MLKKKSFHFSVDDVFESLIEISDKNIPFKKHWFFKNLYEIWKRYKIRTGIHLFYEGKVNGKMRTLKDVKKLNKREFKNWLYFGPHALNVDTPPYTQSPTEQKKCFNKIIKNIDRFAGKNNYANYIRLHHYSESFELSNFFKKNKFKGLFSTDRKVGSHKMPKKISKKLLNKGYANYNNLNFIRTDFRVEWLKNKKKEQVLNDFKKIKKTKEFIILYSHEYEFKNKKVSNKLMENCEILTNSLNYKNIRP
jgi:hypothetical protein